MRRRRMLIVLLLALISGASAAWLALNYLRQRQAPTGTPERAATEVVVAARDLPLGTVVDAEDIKLVEWPAEVVPEGYSTDSQEVLGRGVISPIRLNEPVLSTKLALKEAGGGLPITIPEGMRAVSVRVDEVVGVAGFVLPGTRVDVLVTLDQGSFQNNPVTRVILQNVAVLTAGQTIETSAEGEPQTVTVITLMVSPEEAEQLVLASTKGQIQLALRNTLDQDSLEMEGVRMGNLIPAERVVRRAPRRTTPTVPSRQSTSIEVYRGPELTTENVDEGGSP